MADDRVRVLVPSIRGRDAMKIPASDPQSTETVLSVQNFWQDHVNNEYYTDQEYHKRVEAFAERGREALKRRFGNA